MESHSGTLASAEDQRGLASIEDDLGGVAKSHRRPMQREECYCQHYGRRKKGRKAWGRKHLGPSYTYINRQKP